MEMKRLAIWTSESYGKDVSAEINGFSIRDGEASVFKLIKEEFFKKNWDCKTFDIYKSQNSIPDAVLFFDMPRLPLKILLGNWYGKTKNLIVLLECEVIRPNNWKLKKHKNFDKIFTWNDQFIDNSKCFKINFPNRIPLETTKHNHVRQNFCTMIARHKKRTHSLELYSKREEAIRWFEAQHPEDFDLYGIGWDRYVFEGQSFMCVFNRIDFIRKIFARRFFSYKGPVIFKKEIFEKYKFAICYENASVPGYITEKIFDCFFSGCIPIYWGAPDIHDYIPKECFIDKRDFSSYEELYKFLKSMTDKDCLVYISAANDFLASKQAYVFSENYFIETLIKGVVNEK
jgi:alpha(1,3/1,4) fucosyltransferase